jgi:hypothetical protein
MTNRFDLEQQIMNCWNIVDDIKALSAITDHRATTEDEVQNYLLGLATIYQVKFETLFHTFENCIKERSI